MEGQRFLEWYYNYALALGVTSHRLVAGRLQQTWLTRSYALIVNVIVVVAVPALLCYMAIYLSNSTIEPIHFSFTIYLFLSVCFASIVSTVFSRGSRDADSLELHRIVFNLRRISTDTNGNLKYLLYLKFGTMTFLCLSNFGSCFFIPENTPWTFLLASFCISNAMNMIIVSTYRYFMSLWLISGCYQYINRRLDDISNSVTMREPLAEELRELHRLWSLHSQMTRCIQRLNKVYSLPLLVGRFDFVTFSVINGYWGLIYALVVKTGLFTIAYGFLNYWVHMLDFFLVDTMCDITVQYQNAPHHTVTEGSWSRQVLLF